MQVIEAKTPQLMLQVEGEDGRVDPSMMRDDRMPERAPEAQDGATIDHGGYQAAAVAFQQQMAQKARGGAPGPPTDVPALMDFKDEDLDWD